MKQQKDKYTRAASKLQPQITIAVLSSFKDSSKFSIQRTYPITNTLIKISQIEKQYILSDSKNVHFIII